LPKKNSSMNRKLRKKMATRRIRFPRSKSAISIFIRLRKEADSGSCAFQSNTEATGQWRREAESDWGTLAETKAMG
jgi:hypothetical protein